MIMMSASTHRSASVARDIMADKQQSDVSELAWFNFPCLFYYVYIDFFIEYCGISQDVIYYYLPR